jgi:hypothetical protein
MYRLSLHHYQFPAQAMARVASADAVRRQKGIVAVLAVTYLLVVMLALVALS